MCFLSTRGALTPNLSVEHLKLFSTLLASNMQGRLHVIYLRKVLDTCSVWQCSVKR